MTIAMSTADVGSKETENLAETDKDLPLREDIRFLGRMLGDTLREQEGESAFDLVENIRQTAIRFHRDQDPKARQELDLILNRLSDKDSLPPSSSFASRFDASGRECDTSSGACIDGKRHCGIE